MGFHHVGQGGLEFLTSDDSPTLASHSAGITGVSHCAWPGCIPEFLIHLQMWEAGIKILNDMFVFGDAVILCHSGWHAVA